MSDKLDAYLEEISHFLSGRAEREEILAEIRSHIAEKAAEGPGEFGDAAIDRAIAAYGPARRVAERYIEDKPIIAPAYRRFLVRYTSILFAAHAALTVAAVAFKQDFVLFPFIYMPRLGAFTALMYLPTAFLADLGIVALVLFAITQSGKDVRLPWPKFGLDLDEVRPPSGTKYWAGRIATAFGALVNLAIADFLLYVLARRQTVFFVGFKWRTAAPIFTPGPGRLISIVVIAMFALSALALLVKLFTRSRWVDIASNAVSLGLVGVLLAQPFEGLFAVPVADRLLRWLKPTLTLTLLFIALMIAIDLVKHIVVVSRRKMAAAR
jgi:hypothetical protein